MPHTSTHICSPFLMLLLWPSALPSSLLDYLLLIFESSAPLPWISALELPEPPEVSCIAFIPLFNGEPSIAFYACIHHKFLEGKEVGYTSLHRQSQGDYPLVLIFCNGYLFFRKNKILHYAFLIMQHSR